MARTGRTAGLFRAVVLAVGLGVSGPKNGWMGSVINSKSVMPALLAATFA
jgi:hypothetical protein